MTLFLAAPLLGCAVNDISWVRLARNPVSPTVIDVSWRSEDPGPSWVEFGTSEDYSHATPVVDDGSDEHSATLVGMPPGTDVYLKVFTELPGGTVASSWNRILTTGTVPDFITPGVVTVHDEDAVRDGLILLSHVGERGSVQLIDRAGHVLWALAIGVGSSAPGVVPTVDGGAFSFQVLSEDREVGAGEILTVGLDGLVQQQTVLDGLHHAFGQHPAGTLAVFSTEIRDVEDHGPVAGDRVLGVAPGGAEAVIFDAWEQLELTPGDEWDSGFFPGAQDWTHMNGTTWHPDPARWLITVNGTEDVIEVDPDSGELTALYSLDDAAYSPATAAMTDPHGPDWSLGGDLLLFGSDEAQSWCSAYDVSEPGLFTETWTHGRGEGLFAMAMGEARQLTDGNILCNFGTAGIVRELTDQGEVVWEYVAPPAASLGQTRWMPDPYEGLWEDGLRR